MARAQAKPSSPTKGFGFGDVIAGISVALIAVPQALAYAELAGMPAYTGLYAVALPAIVAAFLVSSPYLQTGPVATTSLLTFGVLSQVATPGSSDYVAAAGLLALIVGVVRFGIGLLRFGQVAYLLSYPVLLGFVNAAAILILASQLPTALGVEVAEGGVLERAFRALIALPGWDWLALLLAALSIAVVLLGRKLHPLFPGVLVAMLGGLLLGTFGPYTGAVVGDIPAGLPPLGLEFPWGRLGDLIIGGSVIALVGFAEAASIARTYATQDRNRWNSNQEFLSQGAANIAAGLFGGFPVGGSFSRSSVNRLAGAKTRWSGLITGLGVLAVLPFTGLFANLPRAVLAAIVIAAVVGLLALRELAGLRKASRSQAYIAWLTFGLTLVLAPRIDLAVLIGIGLAVAHHLRREQMVVIDSWIYDDVLHFKPQGVLWFGSASSVETAFSDLLADHPESTRLTLHLGGLGRIDLSAAKMLKRLIQDARQAGLEVELLNVPPMAQSWLERVWDDID